MERSDPKSLDKKIRLLEGQLKRRKSKIDSIQDEVDNLRSEVDQHKKSLKRATQQISLLSRVGSAAVRDDADDVFHLVLSLTLSVLKARQGSILLVDRYNSELFIKDAIGLDEEIVRTFRTKLGQGISGWVAKQRTPLLIPDIEKDPRFRKISDPKYETRSLLCAPLVKKNRVLGVVNINNKVDGSSFSREELALLTALADQMAIIVENALLLRESAEKAADLREANAKLTQANREKKEFLARVSHELRTPLNAIKGAVHYLKNASENVPPGRLQEFLGIIDHDSGRLSQMISDLLEYARLEDEEIVLSKTPLLLGKLVEEALLGVRGQAQAKEIQIKTRIPSRAGKVPADHDRILRLLADLLSNLIHFATPRSTIHASLMENRPAQVIQIACDGCEIPEDEIGHIFDPPGREADLQAGASFRTGLGLYISRRILELHGGGLELDMKPGGEVRFLLTFDMTADRVVTRLSHKAFDLLNDLISEIMDVRISSIMMIDETSAELSIRSARGLDDETIRRTRLRLGDNIAGWVALEGRPLLIEDIEKDLVLKRTSISQYETRSLLSVPIRAGDRVLGVLNVNNKEDGSVFNKVDLERAGVLAERVARLAETLSGDPDPEYVSTTAAALNQILNAYRRYKTGHRRDMLAHLLPLLDTLDLAEDLRREIVFASLFHDMGLVAFPEQVLAKPGAFTPSEWEMMQTHPDAASDILGSLLATETGRGIIRHHHESFDGTGYPDGLRGEQIPVGARILSIVDAYAAMLTSRPYAPPRTPDEAQTELRRLAGSRFDPLLVEQFLISLRPGIK